MEKFGKWMEATKASNTNTHTHKEQSSLCWLYGWKEEKYLQTEEKMRKMVNFIKKKYGSLHRIKNVRNNYKKTQ